ncbi:MAG: response regulator [Geitlerinemataceae cyanobacterium]
MKDIQTPPIDILLVEDSASDAKLIIKAFKETARLRNIHIVEDGVQAIAFLRREGQYTHSPRPHLILLDLNLPKKTGLEVLADIKSDLNLRSIPVIVLTTSEDEEDILTSYQLQANCYIHKPFHLQELRNMVELIDKFWLELVKLPSTEIYL